MTLLIICIRDKIKEDKVDIQGWRKVISKYFLGLLFPAEVGLSVLCQLRIKDIRYPFGLVYLGVPSSGKTITLNFFSELGSEFVFTTDDFTPSSFVSHAVNVEKDKLPERDLLPKIKNKILLVRDLTPMFAKREEDLTKLIGILTRVFDGEGYESNTGVHGKRGYKGEHVFMFLAASTPIGQRAWKGVSQFGARLFFLNVDPPDKNPMELANQISGYPSVKKKEKICREATKTIFTSILAN